MTGKCGKGRVRLEVSEIGTIMIIDWYYGKDTHKNVKFKMEDIDKHGTSSEFCKNINNLREGDTIDIIFNKRDKRRGK